MKERKLPDAAPTDVRTREEDFSTLFYSFKSIFFSNANMHTCIIRMVKKDRFENEKCLFCPQLKENCG